MVPFVIGVIVLAVSVLFHRLGSKRPGPQALWFFVGVFGAIFIFFPGIKMIKFRQHLKTRHDNNTNDTSN